MGAGFNVHVQSGTGSSSSYGAPNGLGNLFVGYNANKKSQSGSHNLVREIYA